MTDEFPKPVVDKFPNREGPGDYGMHRTVMGLDLAVARCINALTPVAETFDAVYVTGLSGVVPGAVVCHLLRKELLVLRKDHEYSTDSHGVLVEGVAKERDALRYVILDDFVANGGTMRRLLQYRPRHGEIVGVVLYGHPRGEREIANGYAKEFWQTRETSGEDKQWRLVRRGPESLLFDLVPAPVQPAKHYGKKNAWGRSYSAFPSLPCSD